MRTTAPRLRSESEELLSNIDLVKRIRGTDAEGSLYAQRCLYEDLQRLVRWLEVELQRLVPSLRGWCSPWPDIDNEHASVNIEADSSWTRNKHHAVALYFNVSLVSPFDDKWVPNVGLWIDRDLPLVNQLRYHVDRHRPPSFASEYGDGTRCDDSPFWKPLPLEAFMDQGHFNMERFVREIVAAFEELAPIRPVIDEFMAAPHTLDVAVPRLSKALILDLETWGPGSAEQDEIVEVGLILTAYDPVSGELAGILDHYGQLRDPGPRSKAKPSERITKRTVSGKKLDAHRIEDLISQADVIIAHNASFDKPHFEKLFPTSKKRPWLCSVQRIPWAEFGIEGSTLENLCQRIGVTNHDQHRALTDAEALLNVLAQRHGALSFFATLIASKEERDEAEQSAAAGAK